MSVPSMKHRAMPASLFSRFQRSLNTICLDATRSFDTGKESIAMTELELGTDSSHPILAALFAQMDYMDCKGSGLGMILDADEREAPNLRGLKPQFFSSSGSFRVVLPNLNHEAGKMSVANGEKDPEASRETVNETANETVKAVEKVIAANPGVKIIAIVAKTGKSRATVARALATLQERGRIVYRGSAKTGGYFAKDG